jgi:hypothetical protein
MEYTKEQVEQWKAKAEKWDKLDEAISKFYCNADGEYDEEEPEQKGDLCDIGEAAATAFGYF